MMPASRTPLRLLLSLVLLSAATGSTLADWVPSQVFTAVEYAEDNSQFGRAVAADGEWLFIGQPLSSDGGKVHVFRNTGGTWNRTQVISNPAGANGSQFGRELDLSGTTAVLGAPAPLANANARAYIYEESGGTWSLEATLSSVQPARSQSFASHVATSGDFVLVGDNTANYNNLSQQGAIDVFRRDGMGGWFNKLLGGVSPDQVNAGGGVNEKAWIFGNDFDIFGEQVLATARVRNPDLAADSDQQGLYPSFNDTSIEGGIFLPYPGGSPAPIAPGVPLVAGATYSRPDRIALQNDGKGVAVVSFLDGSPSPVFVSASFVPVTRAPGGWSFGSPIPLPGSATSLQAAGSLALVLQNEELLVFEETSAWNLLDRFDAPTDVTDALAIVGEAFFIGAATASDIGIEQGAVHLYLPRVNTKPVVSLKGGKKLSITGPKAKLSGSVRDDVPGSRLEATFRDGSRTVKKRIRVATSGKWNTALSVPPGSTKVTLTATDSDGAKSRSVKVKILRRP
ncbi:MAG: hypothetical protein KDN18_11510 [Verrucomicrobiae bacterium]|nr:hypothetical protein [Verrucomicrobiae bacterium]